MLANQIFGDRYETTLIDLANGSSRQEAVFNHASRALDALEYFEISIVTEKRATAQANDMQALFDE